MAGTRNVPEDVTPEELAEALRLVRSQRTRPRKLGAAQRAAADEETIFVRGEGGAVFEMAPSRMSADLSRRLRMGRLRRVNPDGSAYRREGGREPVPTGSEPYRGGGSPLTEGRVPRPAKTAPKAAWVEYAVAALGADPEQAEGMSRADLIELPDYRDPAAEDFGGGTVPPEDVDGDPQEQGDSKTDARGRPAQAAPKREWIDHAVAKGLVSREDAANYTKDDLIEMTK